MPLFSRKKSLGERVHKLVERNEVKKLQDLLIDEATGSVAERKTAIEHRDKLGRSPLVVAATRGSFLMSKLLIQAGADVNSSTDRKGGGGALHECAINGFEGVAKLLVEAGADPYLENLQGFTALDYAIMKGYATLVRMFEQCSLFSGWLNLKANRFHGISRRWKPRWVSVFMRTTHPKNGHKQRRLQLCAYKDFESFKPYSRVWLTHARAAASFQTGSTPGEEVFQCILSLPPRSSAPIGLTMDGDSRLGWKVAIRPACSEADGQSVRQEAWTALTTFTNIVNSVAGDQGQPQRRHTTGAPVAMPQQHQQHPQQQQHAQHQLPPRGSVTHLRSLSTPQASPFLAGNGHSRAVSASSMPDIRVPPNSTILPPPGMSDAQLAAWLQASYNQGESSPRLNALMRSISLDSSMQSEGSQPTAASGPVRANSLPRESNPTPAQSEAVDVAGLAEAASDTHTPSAPPLVLDDAEEDDSPSEVTSAHMVERLPSQEQADLVASVTEDEAPESGAEPNAPPSVEDTAPNQQSGEEIYDAQELPTVPNHQPSVSPEALPAVPTHHPSASFRYEEENLSVPAQLMGALPQMQHVPVTVYDKGDAPGMMEDGSDSLCVICLAEPRSAGFVHGDSVHKCCCKGCAMDMKKRGAAHCPICRQEIQHILLNFY